MHNTLSVDGADQSEPDGPFSWKQNFHPRAETWISGKSFDLFVGSHDGYTRLASPVVHRRWVVALQDGLYFVRDVAEGAGQHRLDISWHLAPDLHVQAQHLFRFKDSSQGLVIVPVEDHGWAESIHKGVWSPVYGRQSAATVLNFGTKATLPVEFATVLVPLQEVSDPGTLTQLEEHDAAVKTYRYQAEGSEYRFFFALPDQPWRAGSVSSDAEFVCVFSRSGSDVQEIVFCKGSYVEIAAVRSLRTKYKVQRCEFTGGRVLCSDPDAPTSEV